MRRALSWLWHEHDVGVPGWLIVAGLVWVADGTVRDLARFAEWIAGWLP